jgi:hypothetical protein
MNKSDFVFVYNKNVAKYLKENGIYSITTGLHPTTHKMFTLFVKSECLQRVLDQYKNNK